MKTKIVLSAIAMLGFTAAITAQKSGPQLKAGINLANISVTDDGAVSDANMLTSFQLGVVTDIPVASIFYLQPGLLFSGKGAKVESGTQGTLGYYKATANPYYLEVPVNVLVKLPLSKESSFNVSAGPYLGVGIAGRRRLETSFGSTQKDIDFSNDDPTTINSEEGAGFGIMRRFDYGINTGLGIEGKSLVLSAQYGLGLAKLQSGTNNNADNNNKHRVLSFTIGFKL